MGQKDALEVEGLSFAYPVAAGEASGASDVLHDVSLSVPAGAFCLLVGDTGSGKSTLLRLCKPEIAPAGDRRGAIRVFGREVGTLDVAESARDVGYVFQSPDNQIVCDSVWHELSFGLENLGTDQTEMRRRVAEICYFLGIEPWFHRRTAELSGGQRQVLALAATLAMRPRLLLLDEPTSMLDPVAERDFLSVLFRVNRELGCTVVVATHTPAPMADVATMALGLQDGRVAPRDVGSLREVRPLLSDAERGHGRAARPKATPAKPALRLREAWVRYDREADWVLRGCGLEVRAGETRAVVGGNGSGKSTLLAVVAGTMRPQRGSLRNDLGRSQALLPQNPKALFSCDRVADELMEWSHACAYDEAAARDLLDGLGLDAAGVWERHPYDLSGGQQQLVALAKLLLAHPRLLLLDEPTKGLDWSFRRRVALAVRGFAERGGTVVVATHDRDFVRATCDTTSMLFDGSVTLTEPTGEFAERSWLW